MSNVREIKRETARRLGNGDSEAKAPDRNAQLCTAPGCPCQWSCDMGKGKLCSWHDVAKRSQWPEVTAQLVALLAAGKDPVYPTIPQAAWVKDAAARVTRVPGEIGEHLAKRPSRQQVRGYADELGIDVEEEA